MRDFKTILLATDFSPCSKVAFEYAYSMAKRCSARLHLLHVMCEPVDLRGFYVPHISFEVLESEIAAGAQAMMEQFCSDNIPEGTNYTSAVVGGVAHDEIINQASEVGADIIVLGSHGRSGIDQVLFGNIAEKVVRKSPLPVMTVPCTSEQ